MLCLLNVFPIEPMQILETFDENKFSYIPHTDHTVSLLIVAPSIFSLAACTYNSLNRNENAHSTENLLSICIWCKSVSMKSRLDEFRNISASNPVSIVIPSFFFLVFAVEAFDSPSTYKSINLINSAVQSSSAFSIICNLS